MVQGITVRMAFYSNEHSGNNRKKYNGGTMKNTQEQTKRAFGTKEWAEKNFNLYSGCANDCTYCYAKAIAIRFKRKTVKTWKKEEELKSSKIDQPLKKYQGTVMFPSTHDITPEHLPQITFFLKRLIRAGNNVLIVSKPRFECIKVLCKKLKKYKKQVTFRSTIGSCDDEVLSIWEPDAPTYEERLRCLKLAYAKGYKTSVSCEPMLDTFADWLVEEVDEFVTDTIWIGKMNKVRQRLKVNGHGDNDFARFMTDDLLKGYSNHYILSLYKKLRHNPKIRWKDSISEILDRKGLKYNRG